MKVWRKSTRGLCLLSGLLFFCTFAYGQEGAKGATTVDLLVTGATIVSMDGDRHVIENGFVAVRGDEIVGIGNDIARQFPQGRYSENADRCVGEAGHSWFDQWTYTHTDDADARAEG